MAMTRHIDDQTMVDSIVTGRPITEEDEEDGKETAQSRRDGRNAGTPSRWHSLRKQHGSSTMGTSRNVQEST